MTEQNILNRPLKRSWLDAALRAVRVTSDPGERQAILDEALFDEGLGSVAITKTVRVLKNIWWDPPKHARQLIEWGRKLDEPVDTRVLHMGAMLGVYPFIGTIYAAVGTILRQSEIVTNNEVKRRVVAKWGDRESVQRAVLMALNTLKSLEILRGDRNSDNKRFAKPIPVAPILRPWLAHVLLITRSMESIDVVSISSTPELFGFDISEQTFSSSYPHLELFNEGGERRVLATRKSR